MCVWIFWGFGGFLGQETGDEGFEALASYELVELVDPAGFGGPPICLPHIQHADIVANSFAH